MARSSAQEAGKPSARKRQLNLIYFVDSARTKSLTIPLGRLKLLAIMLVLLVAWSAGSTAVGVWLYESRADLAQRMQTSLATIFEYESRYDHVYETAYPPEGRKGALPKIIAETSAGASKAFAKSLPEPVSGPSTAGSPPPVAGPASKGGGFAAAAANTPVAPSAAKVAADAVEPKPDGAESPAADVPLATKPVPKVAADPGLLNIAQSPEPAEKPATAAGGVATKELNALISVTNPVLEPKDGQLELRFDLTNRSNKERAEGYLWAVAEFKHEDGKILYVGAPSGIDVNDAGEPRYPQRSASFGIKHFKKKSFSFPYAKDRPGTFTGIRIGVMDKTGSDRTTYNVPVEIRVPKGT